MNAVTTVAETADTRELISNVSKLGLSLNELSAQANSIQALCHDFSITKVSEKNMRFDSSDGELLFVPDNDILHAYGMTPYAFSQLCNKVGVPVRYAEKCLGQGMLELAAENINTWISQFDKNLFIREYDNKIRGILSDRYMTLDTPEILDVLSDVVDPKQYSTKGYLINPERFHARIVQNQMMNIAGEDLFAGVQIDSSDVGRSTLIVRFFIFKQVCTNGLCVSKGGGVLFQQRHIGISADAFRTELKESFNRIPELIAQSVGMITTQMKNRISLKEDKVVEALTQHLSSNLRLSAEDIPNVFTLMQERYTPTTWGLVNSLTEVAQNYTLERRLEIEKAAGDMLYIA